MRREHDSHGSTDVPADRYWGAGTQRALNASPAADDRIPERFYRCYGYAKQAAAMANGASGLLQPWKCEAISVAATELIEGKLTDHLPLAVGQSGSGCAIDINVNEVLANRSIQLLGGVIGSRSPVDPAKDVNLAQSAATTFTTAMHIAVVMEIEESLVPKAAALASVIERESRPGYAYRLRQSLRRIDEAEGDLHEVFVGESVASASSDRSGERLETFAHGIAAATKRPFIVAGNTSPEACSLDPVIAAIAAVRGLAVALLGITEDAALPLGLDASAVACRDAIAEDARVVAGSNGQGAARAMRPMVIWSILNAIQIVGDVCDTMLAVFAGPSQDPRRRSRRPRR